MNSSCLFYSPFTRSADWRSDTAILALAPRFLADPPQTCFGSAAMQRSGHWASTHLGAWGSCSTDM